MDLNLQIRNLYTRLIGELDHIPRGGRFHSVREIITRFQTNRRVVDGALKRMVDEQLLRRVPHVGYFSNVDRCRSGRNVLLLRVDYPSEYIRIWSQLVRHLEETGLYRLEERLYPYDSFSFSHMEAERYDAVLILKSAAPFSMAEMRKLAEGSVPAILLDGSTPDWEVSSISGDHYFGGMLAADYLIRHGHRKLLALNPEPPAGNVLARLNGFFNYARMQGVEPKLLECNTRSGEPSPRSCFLKFSEYLARNGADFTAAAVFSDGCVASVYAALADHGLRIPDDVSVIGYDGLESGAFLRPAVTTVAHDFDRLGELLREKLEQVFLDRRPFHELVPMHVLERGSVRNPTHRRLPVPKSEYRSVPAG